MLKQNSARCTGRVGRLRSPHGSVRAAQLCPCTGPLFAQSAEMGCIVKSNGTETKTETGEEMLERAAAELRALGDEIRANGSHKEGGEKPRAWDKDCGTEAVKQLRQLADAVKSNAVEQRALLLGSIEALLAGADILSCDCIEMLRTERDVLSGGTQSQQLELEELQQEIPFEECADQVKRIEAILDAWQPQLQRAILSHVGARLPEKEAAWATESARDESRDELLNYLHNNRSMPEQAAIYRVTLAAVKNDNGVVEMKQAS